MGTPNESEKKILQDLAVLLKKNADKILSGETKLCLTTSSLGILATNIRRLSENESQEASLIPTQKKKKATEEAQLKQWRDTVRTLYDFILKTVSLKIIHGSYTMQAPIQINKFQALQVLEVKKVPIHMVEGLSKLRGQLKKLIMSRSLQKLENLFEICGGDRSTGMVWQQLTSVLLGFNGLCCLDNSLRFIPHVEVLDLSHNGINKTEDYLQNLTDVLRVNLGFNALTLVPQFSYSNRGKLRTLVLRRNNLDNLEGLEELTGLEELDVADNCLVDHQCLHVLAELNHLSILCLMGNPLSYKPDHRVKTLEFVSPRAGLGLFLLDNTRLTTAEELVLKNTYYERISSDLDNRDLYTVVATGQEEPGTSGVSEIGVTSNLLKPSHLSKKSHGHRRKKSRERFPVIVDIADINDSLETEDFTGETPTESSLSSSYHDEARQEEIEQERRKIEILRDHHKDDWLRALNADEEFNYSHNSDNQSGSGVTQQESDIKSREPVKPEITKPEGKDPTQDSINTGIEEQEGVEDTVVTVSEDKTDGEESKPAVSPEPVMVEIRDTTDIYDLRQVEPGVFARKQAPTCEVSPPPEMVKVSPDTRGRGIEWTRSESEQEAYHGEESEPFIVMLPNADMKQLLVSVNERYIIEKDLSGTKQAMLDLKCLESVKCSQQPCLGKDIVTSIVFPVLKLEFSYVRKDMRQREYAMENRTYAESFEALVIDHVKVKEMKTRMKELMECLKCKNQFYKQDVEPNKFIRCPKCKGKVVIELNIRHYDDPSVEGEPPVTESSDYNKLSRSLPSDQSQQDKDVKTGKEYSPFKRKEAIRRSLKKEVTEEMSRSQPSKPSMNFLKGDTDSLNPEGKSVQSVEEPVHITRLGNQSRAEDTSLTRNQSWSGIGTAPRTSISSVDSDITILGGNSSRSSVAVISESSSEGIQMNQSHDSHVTSTFKNKSSTSLISGHSGDISDDCFVTEQAQTQGQITPVGSPLNSSVCSSMVSSVYENTLAATDERDSDSKDFTSNDSAIIRRSTQENKTLKRHNRSVNIGFDDLENFEQEASFAVSQIRGEVTDRSGSEELSIYCTADNTLNTPGTGENRGSSLNITSIYDKAEDTHSDESFGRNVQRRNRSSNIDAEKRKAVSDYIEAPASSSFKSDNEEMLHDLQVPESISPIKRRSRSPASSRKNRSAIFIDDPTTGTMEGEGDNSRFTKDDNSDFANVTSSSYSKSYSSASHSGDEVDTSIGTNYVSQVTRLPWEEKVEQPGGQNKMAPDEFVNIDNRLQLFLQLNVFKEEEACQCAIECNVVQYMKSEMRCFVVVASERILIFQLQGDYHSDSLSDWLHCIEDQPITELRFIDIGLCYQSLRLEFGTDCSSFTLLIADEGRCQRYLTLLSGIVQKVGITNHSRLEGISKSSPSTLENIQSQIVTVQQHKDKDGEDEEQEEQELVKYFIIQFSDTEDADKKETLSLVVTTTDMVLVKENHQWPLPRLQAPLSDDMKGRQFTVRQRETISSVEIFEFNEYDPRELRLSFVDEMSEVKNCWVITMETTQGVKALVDSIRGPWEEQFGISLDVTPASFSETT